MGRNYYLSRRVPIYQAQTDCSPVWGSPGEPPRARAGILRLPLSSFETFGGYRLFGIVKLIGIHPNDLVIYPRWEVVPWPEYGSQR
jgi:hypothetical protein